MKLLFRVCALTVLLVGWPPAGAGAAAENAPSYLPAQAEAGKKAYAESCASCHGAKLEGMHLMPPLAGETFDQAWRGKSVDALAFHVRRMPIDPVGEPGSLSDETYAELTAYILQVNGLPAGDEGLPSDLEAMSHLTIPLAGDAPRRPDAPVAAAQRRTELLDGLPAVTGEMLLEPPPSDWLQWGRTSDGHNFSPLDQVNRETVGRLTRAWRSPLRAGENMPSPVVHRGVMLLHTFPDTVLALDAANGSVLWRYRHESAIRPTRKMGVALDGDKVIVPTSDLHVVALDVRTGEPVWDHAIAPETPQGARRFYQLRSAPLVVGDKVLQGVTAAAAPKGGFLLALDAASGEEVWRFNTLARPGEPGGNTWNDMPLEERTGGSIWHQPTWDPELDLVFFGVAPTYNTGPLLHPVDEPGVTNDALYTDCTVALDADTGELVWYYQHLANDQWDLDWVFERQIVTLPVDGSPRKVVLNVGKMAILEALDAATGEYLFSIDAGVQNVITAIDQETGAKTVDSQKMPDLSRRIVICPSAFGARSWPPTSYSRRTRLVYVPLVEWCMAMGQEGMTLLSSGVKLSSAPHPDTEDGMMARLQAFDPVERELAWTHHKVSPITTSVLATAGGLVFAGDLDPSLKAFDDTTGELLWQAALDELPSSTLVSYSVGDTHYVAVVVGQTNNVVRDFARAYREFRPDAETPEGGAAVWAFALER